MGLSRDERHVLRELAQQYAEVAALDIHREKVELWKSLNRGKMQRPMVLMDQLPWHELESAEGLAARVSDPYFRQVETVLRQTLYKWKHLPVDMVVEPFIVIPRVAENTWYGIGVEEDVAITSVGSDIFSHAYRNQISEPEDINKIKDMRILYDEAETRARLEEAEDVFGDILPVRQSGVWFHLGLWDKLSEYMGIEDIYLDLIDRPDFLHALMERMTEATIAGIEETNRLQVHNDIANLCHCSSIYTDELLPAPGESKGSVSQNCWAFGMAQLFSSVSPQTTLEFELPYIKRLAPYFGMLYYGCCEKLDDRLEMVLQIPNVRKVSCSPWSNKDCFAEKIGSSIVMSNKPNPAFLAQGETLDADLIRRDLTETMNAAKRHGANVEFILKDISTVGSNPEKLTEWAETAMQMVQSW